MNKETCKNHLSMDCKWIDERYRQLSLTCKNSFNGNIMKELSEGGEGLKVFSQISVPVECSYYDEQLVTNLNDNGGGKE